MIKTIFFYCALKIGCFIFLLNCYIGVSMRKFAFSGLRSKRKVANKENFLKFQTSQKGDNGAINFILETFWVDFINWSKNMSHNGTKQRQSGKFQQTLQDAFLFFYWLFKRRKINARSTNLWLQNVTDLQLKKWKMCRASCSHHLFVFKSAPKQCNIVKLIALHCSVEDESQRL